MSTIDMPRNDRALRDRGYDLSRRLDQCAQLAAELVLLLEQDQSDQGRAVHAAAHLTRQAVLEHREHFGSAFRAFRLATARTRHHE